MSNPPAFDLMSVLDQFSGVVATMTGMKQQLIDAGFEPANAELLVVAVCQSNAAPKAETGEQ